MYIYIYHTYTIHIHTYTPHTPYIHTYTTHTHPHTYTPHTNCLNNDSNITCFLSQHSCFPASLLLFSEAVMNVVRKLSMTFYRDLSSYNSSCIIYIEPIYQDSPGYSRRRQEFGLVPFFKCSVSYQHHFSSHCQIVVVI